MKPKKTARKAAPAAQTVWVSVIHHRHGIDVQVSGTVETAKQRLYGYCRGWWCELGIGAFPEKASRDAVIELYFEEADSWPEAEYCDGPIETMVR